MFQIFPFLALLFMMGCNAPSPQFRAEKAQRVTVAGSTFDVRVCDLRAEAIRVNPQYAPRLGSILERAGAAIEMVSGCEVVRIGGDQALAIGTLNCGHGPPPRPVVPVTLDCVPVRGSGIPEWGQVRVDLDCDPA